MNRQMEDMLLMDEDEICGEAQRRIKECREKSGRKLDFSCLQLTKIPPEIAELTTLEELDISNIEIKEIPAFLGNIASLKKLTVGTISYGSHYVNGKLILPPQLGNLRNLQNLSLGYGISEVPQWVFDHENLQALSIYNDGAQTIPAQIAKIKKLRKLRVYGNNITSLPREIGEQFELTVLDLKCPKLPELPESFANLKKMKCIRLDNCNFSAIPDFICGWTELEDLEINIDLKLPRTNILTASRFDPQEIELAVVKANQGPFTVPDTIPRNIGNLQKLKHLILEGTGLVKIPDSLGDCPLRYLHLTGNFKNIPETFGNLSNLKMLYLSSGKPLTLPDSIGKLRALKELNIHAPEIRTIPVSIGMCKNLKIVSVSSDKLPSLPESFCNLKKLETLSLDTFALKKLPAAFGSLRSLKYFDVFSGALTALPESMCRLKNLNSLNIDAFNIKKLPSSFNQLSYVKRRDIKIGEEERAPVRTGNKKKRVTADFNSLVNMRYSWKYCRKLLETFSSKELEALLCSSPSRSSASEEEKNLFEQIMLERRIRLNKKFKWTDENKNRIVKVSDEFLKAWEEGFSKAKKMIEALNPAGDKYSVEIVLYPHITYFKEDEYRGIYSAITDHLNSERDLSMCLRSDTLVNNENCPTENIHVSRKLSWNIEGLGDIELEDSYICYALHVLYSHNEWAFEDILKINSISTELRISCGSGEF